MLSATDSNRLDAALADLDFMVSVDIYCNETTRHADVILPPPSPLERTQFDMAFYYYPGGRLRLRFGPVAIGGYASAAFRGSRRISSA